MQRGSGDSGIDKLIRNRNSLYGKMPAGSFLYKENLVLDTNVIKLRNIEKSQIEKYGIFSKKSVDNSHDLCGRFYQILRSGR